MADHKIRTDIEILKAIAITFIVLYHLFELINSIKFRQSGLNLFNGGFLGVDVFFVISGYFNASAIFPKISENSFELFKFYKRRFIRIVPPLIVVICVSLIAGYFLLFPAIFKELLSESVYSLFFASNYYFANSGGYFSLNSFDKVLIHLWYLSITVQFYIFFPAISILIAKVLGKSKVRSASAIMFIISLLISFLISNSDRGYLLTQYRVWELFAGAYVFSYRDELTRMLKQYARVIYDNSEIVGLALILISICTIDITNKTYRPVFSLSTVIGTSLIILSPACRILKSKFLCSIGKGSYLMYLWHWPLLVFIVRCGYESALFLLISMIIANSLIVIYSNAKQNRQYAISGRISFVMHVCLYVSLASLCIFLPKTGFTNYLSDFCVYDVSRISNHQTTPKIILSQGSEHVFQYGDQNRTPHVYMIGDSNAYHYATYLQSDNHIPIYFQAHPAMMAYGSFFTEFEEIFFCSIEEKRNFNQLIKNMLDKLNNGDKVILASRWDILYKTYCKSKNVGFSNDLYNEYMDLVIKDLAELISKHKSLQFYIVGDSFVPSQISVGWSAYNLEDSFIKHIVSYSNISSDCAEKVDTLVNTKLKDFCDTTENVSFIDRNLPLKDGDKFKIVIDGLPVFLDSLHYSGFGGEYIAKYILDRINY